MDIENEADGTGGGLTAQFTDGGPRDDKLLWTEKRKTTSAAGDILRLQYSASSHSIKALRDFHASVYGGF